MFDDPSVRQLLFHAATKLGIFVVLVFIWIGWIRAGLMPYIRATKAKSAEGKFPAVGLAGCMVLTVAFVYYATFEVGFRQVNRIDNQLIKQRDAHLKESDKAAERIVVPPDMEPTLQEMDDERMKRAERENATERERFNGLQKTED